MNFFILPKHQFQSTEDVHYYYWFRRKVFKVYPYARLASQRLDSLQIRLSRIKKRGKRRRYVKKIQKYIEGKFTDQIKKMTTTEGRILIKLIHRQTGKTAYQNIRELRSGWRAFWYNTTANIFSLTLRQEYHKKESFKWIQFNKLTIMLLCMFVLFACGGDDPKPEPPKPETRSTSTKK